MRQESPTTAYSIYLPRRNLLQQANGTPFSPFSLCRICGEILLRDSPTTPLRLSTKRYAQILGKAEMPRHSSLLRYHHCRTAVHRPCQSWQKWELKLGKRVGHVYSNLISGSITCGRTSGTGGLWRGTPGCRNRQLAGIDTHKRSTFHVRANVGVRSRTSTA